MSLFLIRAQARATWSSTNSAYSSIRPRAADCVSSCVAMAVVPRNCPKPCIPSQRSPIPHYMSASGRWANDHAPVRFSDTRRIPCGSSRSYLPRMPGRLRIRAHFFPRRQERFDFDGAKSCSSKCSGSLQGENGVRHSPSLRYGVSQTPFSQGFAMCRRAWIRLSWQSETGLPRVRPALIFEYDPASQAHTRHDGNFERSLRQSFSRPPRVRRLPLRLRRLSCVAFVRRIPSGSATVCRRPDT